MEDIAEESMEIVNDDNFNLSTDELDIEKAFLGIIQQSNILKPVEDNEVEVIPGGVRIIKYMDPLYLYKNSEHKRKFSKQFNIPLPDEYESELLSTNHSHIVKLRIGGKRNKAYTKRIKPLNIKIKINHVSIPIPGQDKKGFSVDITDFLIHGTNSGHIKGTVKTPLEFRYITCSAVIVKRRSVQDALDKLRANSCIPLSNTRDLVIDILKEGEKDGFYTKDSRITVTLICPLGKTVMETPSRGIWCEHFTCFDALNFLKLYINSSNWMCPICDIELENGDLKIDGFLQAVLKSLSVKLINDQFEFDVDYDGRCFISRNIKQNITSSVEVTTVEDVQENYGIVPTLSSEDTNDSKFGLLNIDDDNSDNDDNLDLEDKFCCICSKNKDSGTDPLVSCRSNMYSQCNTSVHQRCYGIPTTHLRKWLCKICESRECPTTTTTTTMIRCQLCPSYDGALKQTDENGWAHIICGIYIPEIKFGCPWNMEPIITSTLPIERLNQMCCICHDKKCIGACMSCNWSGCKNMFHVTCAQSKGYLCEIMTPDDEEYVEHSGYCYDHFTKVIGDVYVRFIPPFKFNSKQHGGSVSFPGIGIRGGLVPY